MLGRNLRVAHGEAPATRRIDQLPRFVAGRILFARRQITEMVADQKPWCSPMLKQTPRVATSL